MSFINVIPPESAEGKLKEIYRLVSGPGGQVDQVLQVHSERPHTLEGHMALYKATLHHPHNSLPKWFLEAIGVLVSRLNGCDYCETHHSKGMQRLMKAEGLAYADYVYALALSEPGRPFSEAEQAALEYATLLTRSPEMIRQEHIDRLRDRGLDDGQILEVNQVAAYFAYVNRTVTGLGVTTEGETLGLSPQAEEGKEGWRHD